MQTKIFKTIKRFVRKTYQCIESADNFIHRRKTTFILFFILMLVFFGAVILLFNIKTPFQWDDFRLSQIWPNEEGIKVKSFSDILLSQYNHYYSWGGRTLVHIIAQYLVFIDPLKADILNSLVYLIYVTLIYFHIKGRGKHDLLLFAGVNFLVWFLQPVFGETILWLTGSANYLWGTSMILLFMLPYRLYDGQRASKFTILKCVGMFLLGVMAGWTSENTAAAALLAIVIFIYYFYSQKMRVPAWAIVGCIGMIIGYIVMIAAPGNFFRAQVRTEGIPMDFFHLSYRFLTSTQLFVQYLGVFNLIGFILLLLLRHFSSDGKKDSRTLFLLSVYFVATLVAIYVMLFSPFFPPRAWFGVVTFNIISFGVILYHLNYSIAFIRKIRIGMFFFGVMLFAFTFYDAYRDVDTIDKEWKKRTALVMKQKETGEKATIRWTYSRTKFALSDPPFLKKCFMWYYGEDVDIK